jgi:hypothetical protein
VAAAPFSAKDGDASIKLPWLNIAAVDQSPGTHFRYFVVRTLQIDAAGYVTALIQSVGVVVEHRRNPCAREHTSPAW